MKFKISKYRILILSMIFSFLLVTLGNVLSNGVRYVSFESIKESSNKIAIEKSKIEQLSNELIVVKETIAIYTAPESSKTVAIVDELGRRINDLEKFLSFTDVEGPGVIIIVDDAQRELYENENPNRILVHDAQVDTIVRDLRNAGAEAISVNNERYVFGDTKIDCVGMTVKINGQHMSPPFIIRAIGNRNHLEASINAPDKIGEYLRMYGIFLEVNTSISVKINKYVGKIEKKYIKIYEEGDM